MKRSTLLAIVAGIAVIGLVIAAVLVGKQWGSTTTSTTPTVGVTTAPSSSTPKGTGAGTSSNPTPTAAGCVSTPTASGQPITEAPRASWYIADTGQTIPKTAGGPRVMKGRLALCYTPDSLGALTAAVNIQSRLFSDAWEEAARHQTEPAATEAEIAEARNSPEMASLRKPYASVTGFRMAKPISSNVVTLDLHVEGLVAGQAADLRSTVTMVWTGADWKQASVEVSKSSGTSFIEWRP